MAQEIKAIQTHYNGRFFRSRLEARWAVYFDRIGVRYVYEPETFYLPQEQVCYLPDFYLPDYEIYVEIKPDIGFMPIPTGWPEKFRFNDVDTKSWNKIVEFSESHPIALVFGESFGQRSRLFGHPDINDTILTVENGDYALWCCGGDEDFSDIDPYKAAREVALSHRFENRP